MEVRHLAFRKSSCLFKKEKFPMILKRIKRLKEKESGTFQLPIRIIFYSSDKLYDDYKILEVKIN